MQAEVKDLLENPHVARLYARQNCKHCHGCGTQIFQQPDKDMFGNRTFKDKPQLCRCVLKALKKDETSGKDN